MKQLIHRFINWMESAPAFVTFWFLPLVLLIWLIARIKLSFTKGDKKQ